MALKQVLNDAQILCDIQVTQFPVHVNEFPHFKILADQSNGLK